MNNNVSKIVQSAGSISPYQKYSYGKDNLPDVYTMFSNRTQTYTFDSLNRYSKMELSLDKPVTINYIYHLSERNTDSSEKYRTTKLKCEFINNTAYRYNYDKLGNIIQIEQGTRVEGTNSGTNYSANLKYEYDALSQLTRENNKYLNQTITYTYDKGGNITKKTIYPYTAGSLNGVAPTQTIVYNYGNSSWTDLLTSYNGQNITYDAIGNPTLYLGYTLKWNGRQLSSLSGNGTTASYKYDADGLRSYKKVNGVETTYQYVGDKLMYEKRGTTEFYYYYNSFGNLAGIKYVQNGTEYMVYAVCNMRGDVEDLYWGSGNLACHYTYDTWGNVISVTDINGKEITNANHIGLMNPIRYRGYYFDSEIGMYYLQSRYYNPQVGRFINADGYVSTGQDVTGYNMFAYCGNNPVNRVDQSGTLWASVGSFFKKVGNFLKNTFGAGCSVENHAKDEDEIMPFLINGIVTVKKGVNGITKISQNGDSSKPVSVYAKGRTDNPVLSSAGLKCNIKDFSLDISLGLDNLGITGSYTNDNLTNSFGLKVDVTQFKVGFEFSTIVSNGQNSSVSNYTNVSVSGVIIVAVLVGIVSGQYDPSVFSSGSPVPAFS